MSFAVQAFLKVDKDHSGSIDMKEFPALVHAIYEHFGSTSPTDAECNFLMQAFDTNGDGHLSTKEFIDMMASLTGGM